MIVCTVCNVSQIIIGLNDSNGETFSQWQVDASTETTGKGGSSIADANYPSTGMCAADKELGKGLQSMNTMHPWIGETKARSGHVGGQGQRVRRRERFTSMVDTDFCHHGQLGAEVP